MALGPKAMGEAIIANLKRKSGQDLAEWQAVLADEGIDDRTAAEARLIEHGLGKFQAMTVAEVTFAQDRYRSTDALVDDLFRRFPDQRPLFDRAVELGDASGLRLQPCRGYAPLYRDGRIAISFKPTARGLYAALILRDAADWPERQPHKASLGGSTRLTDGVYLSSSSHIDRLMKEVAP
ncbi:hypothetical protein [Microcella sp.]|uniref:hypothetical protein n=1 Tax=Microcella sp. TaxID=1913979 RepID=UPI0025677997|nr:hypothetical protein [Microcella sp.]MBX9471655.1 hypothetical protein [Microcella sp.]